MTLTLSKENPCRSEKEKENGLRKLDYGWRKSLSGKCKVSPYVINGQYRPEPLEHCHQVDCSSIFSYSILPQPDRERNLVCGTITQKNHAPSVIIIFKYIWNNAGNNNITCVDAIRKAVWPYLESFTISTELLMQV